MEKLTIEHLAPYLPYGINVELLDFPLGKHVRRFELDCGHDFHFYLQENKVRPHLRPLCDLTKPITVEGYNDGKEFVPIADLEKLVDEFGNADPSFKKVETFSGFYYDWHAGTQFAIRRSVPLQFYKLLYRWHFDVDGLIKKNLAIDINTVT